MKINGSEIFVKCLEEQGVDVIFGYPGGAILNLYDAIYKNQDKLTHILTSHEQGASHAADGYARSSGKVGVCLATSGPGATNLVTGIATAYVDSVPMVAFTGQVGTSLLGKDSFQEVDITGITTPITKHNYIVKNVEDLADTIRKAFFIAKEGRPGPVLVDICKDVTASFTEYEFEKEPDSKVKLEKDFSVKKVHSDIIKEAATMINTAQKPLIMSGGGVGISDSCEELKKIAEKAQIPVCVSFMGLGTFSDNNELSTGLIGMHGTRASNLAASHADLLIAVGTRFSDRVISDVKKFASNAKILHIDIDPAEIGKNVNVDYHITGNVKDILTQLEPIINERKNDDWIKQVSDWKLNFPLTYKKDGILRPQYIIEKIYEMTKGEALITTEVGQHQLWAAQYYKYDKYRTFISSGGMGTMGYGFGACMGAKIANPDKTVINIAGDGSFRMNCNELATAVHYKLPIIIVIMNNHVLGMVRQWQRFFYEERYSSTTIERGTDFVKLAEAYGAKGICITEISQVEDALGAALSSEVPVVINCEINKDERVYPMVPTGKGINEFIEE